MIKRIPTKTRNVPVSVYLFVMIAAGMLVGYLVAA